MLRECVVWYALLVPIPGYLEARAASQLTHPNTITIHDFGREGDLLYIVMEYLQGESLQHVLKQPKHLRIFNLSMAVLLVASILPVIRDLVT